MKMLWFRRRPDAMERTAIEAAAVERYKQHIDLRRMTRDLRDLRDEVDRLTERGAALEILVRQARPFVGPGELAAAMDRLVGPEPPRRPVTPLVLTERGFEGAGGL